jgi:hypothetical protein
LPQKLLKQNVTAAERMVKAVNIGDANVGNNIYKVTNTLGSVPANAVLEERAPF